MIDGRIEDSTLWFLFYRSILSSLCILYACVYALFSDVFALSFLSIKQSIQWSSEMCRIVSFLCDKQKIILLMGQEHEEHGTLA